MQLHHQEDDAETESGIYYLVPDKYGPGKTLVRRRRPPPTSAPLDDDFDAATTTRGARTEWDPHAHGSERARSRSPPPKMIGVTGASVIVPPLTQGSNTHAQAHAHAHAARYTGPAAAPTATSPLSPKTKNNAVPPHGPNAAAAADARGDGVVASPKGKARGDESAVAETYGEYGQYMSELERKFGGSPDLTLSPARRQDMRSGGAAVDTGGISKIGKPSRLGSPGRAGGVGAAAAVRTRQSFEMVERRVLEDGPERTVTISTWREQVADEADPEADMEVYYLGAADFGDGGGGAGGGGVMEEEDDSYVRRIRRSLPPRPEGEDGTGSTPGSIRTITDEHSKESGPASGVWLFPIRLGHTANDFPKTQKHSMTTDTRKSSDQTSHSRSEQMKPSTSRSSSSPSWRRTSPPRTPHTPDRRSPYRNGGTSSHPPTPRLTNGINGAGLGLGLTLSPPRPSTPLRRSPDRPPHTPPRSSTPHRTYTRQTLAPSFHPTQSGSTISTIKSASVLAFEHVLASCEPPLLHIAPALAKLGIVNEGHLRAVARLSEETRDREVREEAMKQGVTVVEWAILLDKMQGL